MSDYDTKLNCAGEFMMACDDPYQMSQVVGALSSLLDGNIEFIEKFSEALSYSIEQAREFYKDDAQTDCLEKILRFSHTYLAKAYEKRVGRA